MKEWLQDIAGAVCLFLIIVILLYIGPALMPEVVPQ